MPVLDGYVHPDFADVAAHLLDMIPEYEAGGAAVCVYHEGRPVVDVWGGTRDRSGSPWLEHTTAPSFSTTKGIMSTLLHILVDRGLAGYEDRVADHWPAFACEGKEEIRIRHVLCHEAGLYRMSEIAPHPREMLDWNHMVERMAAARPAHAPGAQHGYHALTYGWLVGGLIEAISGRDLQSLLHGELVEPLRLDGAFIGMPEAELHRRALLTHDDGVMYPQKLSTSGWRAGVRRFAEGTLRALGMDMKEFRAALMPFDETFDWNAEETVRAMIPAANGQFTARSLARVYAMYAEGGKLDGVRILSQRAVTSIGGVQSRTRDKVLFLPMHWRLGFHRVFTFRARAPDGFGHFGYGGSGAWCDPVRRISCGLTLNSGVGTPVGDLRIARITRVVLNAVDRVR